jgi:hypothetical protein
LDAGQVGHGKEASRLYGAMYGRLHKIWILKNRWHTAGHLRNQNAAPVQYWIGLDPSLAGWLGQVWARYIATLPALKQTVFELAQGIADADRSRLDKLTRGLDHETADEDKGEAVRKYLQSIREYQELLSPESQARFDALFERHRDAIAAKLRPHPEAVLRDLALDCQLETAINLRDGARTICRWIDVLSTCLLGGDRLGRLRRRLAMDEEFDKVGDYRTVMKMLDMSHLIQTFEHEDLTLTYLWIQLGHPRGRLEQLLRKRGYHVHDSVPNEPRRPHHKATHQRRARPQYLG